MNPHDLPGGVAATMIGMGLAAVDKKTFALCQRVIGFPIMQHTLAAQHDYKQKGLEVRPFCIMLLTGFQITGLLQIEKAFLCHSTWSADDPHILLGKSMRLGVFL